MKYIIVGLFSVALILVAQQGSPEQLNNSTMRPKAEAAALSTAHADTTLLDQDKAEVANQAPVPESTSIVEIEKEIPETVFCGTPAQRNTKRPVRENALLGQKIAKDYGWIGEEWTALLELYSCESSWNHSANNAESGACGIPQSYPCLKLANAIPDYRNNVAGQIIWGYEYIKARYGTPSKALAFHYRSNWY